MHGYVDEPELVGKGSLDLVGDRVGPTDGEIGLDVNDDVRDGRVAEPTRTDSADAGDGGDLVDDIGNRFGIMGDGVS